MVRCLVQGHVDMGPGGTGSHSADPRVHWWLLYQLSHYHLLTWSSKHQTHAADNLHTFPGTCRQTLLASKLIYPEKQMLLVTCTYSHIWHTERPRTHDHAHHCPTPLLYMQSALLPQVRMSHVRLGGPAHEVWRSSGAEEAISSLKRSKELGAAVRAEEDGGGGGGGEGEDALSRKEFPECCPLIWSQPLSSLFFFLPQLYLTSSGFSVTMRKGRRALHRPERWIENAKHNTAKFETNSINCTSLYLCFHAAWTEKGEQEWIMKGYVKQNREWEGWERGSNKEGMQKWLGKRKEKDIKKAT